MYFEDVTEGQRLGPVPWRPSRVQLFRFSAVTWNSHRIHYDAEYARTEGYPDVLVQAHLHGSFLAGVVMAWGSPGVQLIRFRWENRWIVVADELVTVTGHVERVYRRGSTPMVDIQLEERNADGRLCVPAWATVQLPVRADQAGG